MVDKTTGRTQNTHDTTETTLISINDTTAVTIANADSARVAFSATLVPDSGDVDIYIRYYPASKDNIKQGDDVLTRHTMGNMNLFHPHHEMLTDTIYTGEISAISDFGTFDITVKDS